MGKFLSLFSGPWLIYLKLAGIAILVTGASYLAWDYSQAKQQQAITEAVNDATREYGRYLDIERERRAGLQKAIDQRYERLDKALQSIAKNQRQRAGDIGTDIRNNPQFYNQPLPDRGYQEWLKARKAVSEATPAPSPASPQPAPSPDR